MSNGSKATDVDVEGVRTSVLMRGPSDGDEAVRRVVRDVAGTGSRYWNRSPISPAASHRTCPATATPRSPPLSTTRWRGMRDTSAPSSTYSGVRRVQLVVHDLGGPWGLAWAASRPTGLLSLTLVSIGALPGYRWHRYARLYRIPVLGELVLATANRSAVARVLQRGSRRPVPGIDSSMRSQGRIGTQARGAPSLPFIGLLPTWAP